MDVHKPNVQVQSFYRKERSIGIIISVMQDSGKNIKETGSI